MPRTGRARESSNSLPALLPATGAPALSRRAAALGLVSAMLGLAGCGGVMQDKSPEAAPVAGATPATKAVKRIRIAKVANETGRSGYDPLLHYLHLKTAKLLEDSGQYRVVTDDLLAEAPALFGAVTAETPDWELSISLLQVEESDGGTLTVGIFSTQKRNARVRVAASLKSLAAAAAGARRAEGEGESSKGAWGVVAKVDRESMLKGKGYWQLDDSMLGIAAARAVNQSLQRLPSAPER